MRTVNRGADGFGSQMLTAFLGYLNARRDGEEFCYSPITAINLLGIGVANEELPELQSAMELTMDNLGVSSCPNRKGAVTSVSFMENYNSVCEKTFNKEYLDDLSDAWPLKSPYKKGEFNITIHMRRGGDISSGMVDRWTPSKYYNDLIPKLLETYPEAIVHVVSWGDAELNLSKIESSRVKYYSDNTILLHYNMLVHADMYFLASSTFSASAGLFNKNTVLLDPDIMKLQDCPTPELWVTNFEKEIKI